MAKRGRLTREDREKRAAKRARRLDEAPRREADRRERQQARRRRAERLLSAQQAYLMRVRDAASASEVVCERCGLAQGYHHGGDRVSECEGPLGLGCGSTTCVTVESFAEAA